MVDAVVDDAVDVDAAAVAVAAVAASEEGAAASVGCSLTRSGAKKAETKANAPALTCGATEPDGKIGAKILTDGGWE